MVTWSQDILLGYLVDELGARLAYRLMEAGVVLTSTAQPFGLWLKLDNWGHKDMVTL
jgi:hypothetical protein